MGRTRSRQREEQRTSARMLRKHFRPASAEIPVTCDACGRKFAISVPALPKEGGALHVVRPCECGREIAVTLTGRSAGS